MGVDEDGGGDGGMWGGCGFGWNSFARGREQEVFFLV